MATEEKYNLKRQNFVDKTKLYFDFLITELDFETPIHTFSEQSNSVITQDKCEF